jgi:hypothetical protein
LLTWLKCPVPYNSTTGVSGTTGSDPAYLLGVLTGSITSSELSTALNTEITTNTTEITNVRNLYTVKMDNNGFLTGFGLMSTLADGGVAVSDFFTNVNRFAVTAPMTTMPLWASGTAYSVGQSVRISGTTTKILVCKVAGTSGGSAPSISGAIGSIVTDNTVEWQISSSVPFAVLSTSLTANGVTLAPGVYIDGASIVNATIARHKSGLAVDDARDYRLNATKITAGSLQVGSYIQSSNFITGVQGWKIDAAGSVEFGSGTFRGALSGATGTFAGSLSCCLLERLLELCLLLPVLFLEPFLLRHSTRRQVGRGLSCHLLQMTCGFITLAERLVAQSGGTGLGASVKATTTALVRTCGLGGKYWCSRCLWTDSGERYGIRLCKLFGLWCIWTVR